MGEVKPTPEDLNNPYVLQLIEALGRRDEEIEDMQKKLTFLGEECQLLEAEVIALKTPSKAEPGKVLELAQSGLQILFGAVEKGLELFSRVKK